MKKTLLALVAIIALITSSCGNMMNPGNGTNTDDKNGLGNILSGVLGGLANGNTANSLLDFVIGKAKVSQSQLVGTWHYVEPGCAFTSEKLLAQAGGSIAAGKVKEKLEPIYNNLGLNQNNTQFTFTQDGKFQAKVKGLPLSGTYTYNESDCSIKMKTALLSFNGYITRTTKGASLTFESKKLLSLLQTLTALTGNSTLKTVGDLSSEYDGVRVGFNMSK